MAKRKGKAPAPLAFERIELQCAPGWTAELDRVASAVGLSRSAYIRLAVNERLVADRKRLGLTPESKEGGGG